MRSRSGFTFVHLLVLMAVAALGVALLIPTMQRLHEQANLTRCQDNLRKVGAGLLLYAGANGGDLPVSPTVENPHLELVNALTAGHYVADPRIFYCPSEHRTSLSFGEQNLRSGIIGYYYYSATAASEDPALSKFLRAGVAWPRELNTGMDRRTWVLSDIWVSGVPTAHTGYRKGLNYLRLDGSVGFVSESPRQQFH